MSNLNTIDVIIPVKERYNLLINALDSIESQSLKSKNVIIIDDSSIEKIDNFPNYSFKIILIRNEKNMGPSYSCNIGIKKSTSKYIAILETDDLWHESKLEKQINIAKKNNLDFVYCNYFINKKKNSQKFSRDKKEIFDLLMRRWSCPNPSTFLFKRTSFLSIDGFDEKMIGTHDHDLWIRITQSNLKIDFINEFLVTIEDYNPNQMSRDYKTRIKSINYFTNKHKKIIIDAKGISYFKTYKKELLSRALIPGLKKVIKDLDLWGFIRIISYLIFSRIFYKRLISLIFKK